MNSQEREALFPELHYFKNPPVHDFAVFCLSELPEYFFHIPASSSGKYHPACSLGEGGLVRHTRAAMNVARMMEKAKIISFYPNSYGLMSDEAYDVILLALLVHDGLKSGSPVSKDSPNPPNEHTLFEHPLLASHFLLDCRSAYFEKNKVLDPIVGLIITVASEAVQSHMGVWIHSKYSPVILPSPATGDWLAKLVHFCDYFASRKELPFDFSAIPPLEEST